MSNLIFVFPDLEVGGVGVLFSRLVNKINESPNILHDAFIVDYKNGYSKGKVNEVNRIEYISADKKVTLPNNSILIFQHSTVFRLYKNFQGENLTCLFWILHVNNALVDIPILTSFITKKPFSIFYKMFIQIPLVKESYVKFTNKLIEKNGLVSMEESINDFIFSKNSSLKIKSSKRVPVFFDKIDVKENINKYDNFLYLGRLVDFKIGPLYGLIKDLSNNISLSEKTLFVIGDGPLRAEAEEYASNYKINVVFLGTVKLAQLKKTIKINKIGIAFAMGISILECLSNGLKVFGVDVNYSKNGITSYFKPSEFSNSLGAFKRFNSKLDLIREIQNYEVDYLKINKVYNQKSIEELLKACDESNLQYDFIKNYKSKYSFIYKLYYAK